MAQDAFEELHDHRRRRRVNKRGNRKRRKLLQNVRWIIGGVLIGLPMLVLMIYFASIVLTYL